MQHFYKLPKAKTTDQKYNAELDRKLRRIFTSNYYLPKLLQIFGCLLAPCLVPTGQNYLTNAGRYRVITEWHIAAIFNFPHATSNFKNAFQRNRIQRHIAEFTYILTEKKS